jgi:hypothetical protein
VAAMAASRAKPAPEKRAPTPVEKKPAARATPVDTSKPAGSPAAARPLAAGYSGTPLPQKLGIKEGHLVVLLQAPDGFAPALEPLPAVRLATALAGNADVILFFCRARRELEASLARLHASLSPAGGLWIAWPKKAAKLVTDMTEDVVRELALPRGLVDNKVCAIDETWSGLRLVIRKELRSRTR